MSKNEIGLIGLAVMGQNLALNIAEKGFSISVYNRTYAKTIDTEERAKKEGKGKFKLTGYKEMDAFVQSLQKPRRILLLVKAGKPVDQTISQLMEYLEKDDAIIDCGNEYYVNTENRAKMVASKGILYMGMGVSGGEEGARHGPSLMPGGSKEVYDSIKHILVKIAAQVEDSGPCVTYIGPGGSGNYVKMIHNGIEYGDMQLIAEAYDILKQVGGLTNKELAQVFSEWNQKELQSFLIEITAKIFTKKDDQKDKSGELIDKVLDVSGSKGTGKWTVQEAAERGVPCPTISSALDARYISTVKEERVHASKLLQGPSKSLTDDKKKLIDDVRNALYSAKICSYAQGMNIIKKASKEFNWNLDIGEICRIWKGGCIIRAVFLSRITAAYKKNKDLANLLIDPEFAQEINQRQESWRRVISIAIANGVPVPAFSASLAYYDQYRASRLPANLIQAQRDFFGAHGYQRNDDVTNGPFHSEWGVQ